MSDKIQGLPVHATVTEERIAALIEASMFDLENLGICLGCGQEQDACEPDARNYECESCGRPDVFGAQEILIAGYFAGTPKPTESPS